MNLKKAATVVNGFVHDLAAGYWLAAIIVIVVIDALHIDQPKIVQELNAVERLFFWHSVAAVVLVMATGAGRTFTYVDNWYGANAERTRRRMLFIKHAVLLVAFGAGYLITWGKTFH